MYERRRYLAPFFDDNRIRVRDAIHLLLAALSTQFLPSAETAIEATALVVRAERISTSPNMHGRLKSNTTDRGLFFVCPTGRCQPTGLSPSRSLRPKSDLSPPSTSCGEDGSSS